MKTINISALLFFLLLTIHTTAQESGPATWYTSSTVLLNCSFGMGTFAAGENLGGSAFVGSSLSADWKPNSKARLSYGIETGLLGGETNGSIIYGIPAVLRLGWYPGISKNEKIDFFVLVKTGWAFGIWDSQLEKESSPNGIVGGLNFGGRYYLSPMLDVYTEIGYNYYGLARSSNHPEYPLGYGSGKIYASIGLSLKLGKY
jgi:hypothetical protein